MISRLGGGSSDSNRGQEDGSRRDLGASAFSRLNALAAPSDEPPAAAEPTDGGQASDAPFAGMVAVVGRLQHTDASRLWATDRDFATWVAANLDAVAEPASLRLTPGEMVEADTPVVIAQQEGKPVVIVCQRRETSDEAFGCLVRHMAATGARHAVWICGSSSDEHVAGISWLNRFVDGRFVLLKVEAVTIGDSAAAPVFELAVRTPRADDHGVESTTPIAEGSPASNRRADDWPEAEVPL